MKRALCYFSGTGNSLYACQIIKKVLKAETEILPFSEVFKDPNLLNEYQEIGIIFPVYAFDAPDIVLKFCDIMPVSSIDKYVFAIATCGAYGGDALRALEKRLEKNGIELFYSSYVTMPDNYTTTLPAPPEKLVKTLLDSAEKKLRKIAHEVAVKTEKKTPKGTMGLMSPINKAFMSDRGNKDKKFILTRSCDGCGFCQKICPVENIEMVDGKPTFKGNCQFCLACFNRCPKGAINYGRHTIKKPRYINPRVIFKD